MLKEIYIKDCASYIPENRISVESAVQNGLYEYKDLLESRYESILVEKKLYPAEMAILAANKVIKNVDIDNIKNIFFSNIHRHGNNLLWSPASFIQEKFNATNAVPLCLSQGCNAQMLGMDMAYSLLLSKEDICDDEILLVSADSFNNSSFNRWKSDFGILYGDAATAAVISTKPGLACIVGIMSVSSPSLEQMHRLEHELPEKLGDNYDIRETKKLYIQNHGLDKLSIETKNALIKLRDNLLKGHKASDISYFILPNLGKKLLETNYYSVFNCTDANTLWDFGKTVGHLGTGDCIAGLSYLKDSCKLSSGELVFMLGAGSGFSWTGCLIEIC
ncbi:MAG: ketoacyl-ACP synthase III family protein [Pseudomonadota bacterium]